MENGYIHSLDDVATTIWKLFDKYQDPVDILNELSKIYPDAGKETLKKDLEEFIAELTDKKLLISVDNN